MASTIAEAFDTHMSDPADVDISMYTGSAATDSWLPGEASMGDDAYAADAATIYYDQGGIEIEMGDDDAPITEYEMADEGQVYDGLEIQDIEVYDISQVPSPLPMDDHSIVTTTQPHVEDAEIMHIPSSHGHAPEPPLDLHSAAVEATVAPELIAVADSALVGDNVDPTTVANHDLTVYQQDASTAVQTLEALPTETVLASIDGGVHETESSSTISGYFGAAKATVHEDMSGEQTAEHEPYPQYDHSTRSELAQYDNHTTETENVVSHLRVDILDGSATAEALDGNDPHEISDGIYIDPPPAVLLSLPPSTEFGECCLFNLPPSSTRRSPSSSAQLDTGDVPRLLLQERPTLYYEPLSAVFAALRLEESIQNMQGLSEAELVLDAYDLQLSIPEDNIYTHEVTLHELNVIHDGSDLGGPLRLRLKVFTPRFVTRYNMLRDQISRLNLAEDGGTHAELVLPEHYEQDAEYEAQQADEGAEQNHYENIVAQEPRPEAYENHIEGTTPEDESARGQAEVGTHEENRGEVGDRLSEEHSVSGEGVVTGVSPALQAAQLEVAEEKLAGDADADGEYEESGTFDADEIHEHITAEEGGDYTEHADFPDDEDEFGEDLPEEVGGETKDAAYPHIGAADDQPELPQDENDFEREVPTGVVGEHEEQQFDNTGLHTNPYTDAHGESNSAQASETGVEDPLRPTSETFTQEDVLNNLEADNVGLEETTALAEEVEDNGLDDNWDEADTLSSHEDANTEEHADTLSRKSSTTTLTSSMSKRAYEEVDLDDFDDDDDAFFDTSASSPSAKRLRTE